MSMLSSTQIKERPFSYRKGQIQLINAVEKNGKGIYLAKLPGGYGKTLAALAAYKKAKELGLVNRFLYVAPSSTKIYEFNADIINDAKVIGLDVVYPNGAEVQPVCRVTDSFAIQEHRQNTYEFFSATVQIGINKRSHLFDSLTQTGRWFICVDECHHYTQENKYGDFIKGLSSEIILGLSATPGHRTEPPIFTKIKSSNIVNVTLKEAIKEEAIRRIEIEKAEFWVDVEIKKTDIIRLSTKDLEDELRENNIELPALEARKQLRWLGKYYSPLFSQCVALYHKKNDESQQEYLEKNERLPPRPIHQILVFAPSVALAKLYSKAMNNAALEEGFSDWVGTGPQGRTEKENIKIIQTYREGKIPCLIQVAMAGEGFNNPCSSILVFLGLNYAGNQVHQMFLRSIRRNYLIEDFFKDIATIIIPSDSRALPVAEQLQNMTLIALGFDPPEKSKPGGLFEGDDFVQIYIPPIEYMEKIIDAEIKEWVISSIPEKAKQGIHTRIKRKARADNIGAPNLDQWIENVLPKAIDEEIARKMNEKNEVLIAESTREQIQREITNAINKIARGVALLLHAKSAINGSLLGDYVIAIHKYYGYRVAGNGRKWVATKEMTRQNLLEKYKWLKRLADEINRTKKVPIWLKM